MKITYLNIFQYNVRYQPYFSPGLQEYIEAISFYQFLINFHLISPKEIENQIQEISSNMVILLLINKLL